MPTTIFQLITVELPVGAGHDALPAAFWWHGRRYEIAGYGRRWQDEYELWQHLLAQTRAGDTVELRRHGQTGEWQLARAWWQDAAV